MVNFIYAYHHSLKEKKNKMHTISIYIWKSKFKNKLKQKFTKGGKRKKDIAKI